MFAKNTQLFKNKFHFSSLKYFSNHSKLIIIGAGTGGVAAAKQLTNLNVYKNSDITIFDPSKTHYYQPGFTKIAGIPNHLKIVKDCTYQTEDLVKEFNFQNTGIKEVDPDNMTVLDANGKKWTYEQLLVSCGIQVNLDSIPGLHELLRQENNFVGTIYDFNYCQKVAKMRENFKGGKAIFTQPPAPVKCGGGPQKIVYLCNDYWKKHNIKADVHFFTPTPAIFGVKFFSDALQKYADSQGISVHKTSQLISVDAKTATFKNLQNGETFTEAYDFLHVVPHMQVPDFLKGSKISNAGGFVDVGMDMNHKTYKNIWAVGDCIALPNAKTAASVFSQVPIFVENLKRVNSGNLERVKYDGYASCPLYLEEGKLMLAEFRDYIDDNGVAQKALDESFLEGKQNIPRKEFYHLGLQFTKIYAYALKGRWFGKDGLLRPYTWGNRKLEMRFLYKYFVLQPFVLVPVGLFGFLMFAVLYQ